MAAYDVENFSMINPSGTFSSPSGGGSTFDFGSLFGAIAQLGSAGFQFGSNFVAAGAGQQPTYGTAPVIYQQAPQQQQQQNNQGGTSTAMIVAIVLVIIIMMMLIGFAIVQTKKPA
jgi:hypothetical protein